MSLANPRRIGVLFPGALGDFICFLPALEFLGQGAEIDLFARTEFAALAPPRVRVHLLERREVSRLFAPGAAADERLGEFFASYAALYSWTGSAEKEFVDQLAALSRGRARVFRFRAGANNLHQSDYYLSCLAAPPVAARVPRVALRPDAIRWSEAYWAAHSLDGQPVLTLAPGSGAREKNWPVDFYFQVAGWWRRRTHGAVVVLVGPVEEERGGWELFLDHFIVARHLDLAQVAALLARSALYLGNDSGMTHLAAAVGARVVALFGPSAKAQWTPRGAKVTVLSRPVGCSPCEISVMKSCPHHECLSRFYPDDVIAELEQLPEVMTLTRGGSGIRV